MREQALGICVLLILSCSQVPPEGSVGSTPPPCTDGRPASEIAQAGTLPVELRSSELACVLNADRTAPSHGRVYKLKDGRQLGLFEHVGQLPQKPAGANIRESGTIDVAGERWQWSVLDHPQPSLVIWTQRPDLYLELSVTMRDRDRDIGFLSDLARGARAR